VAGKHRGVTNVAQNVAVHHQEIVGQIANQFQRAHGPERDSLQRVVDIHPPLAAVAAIRTNDIRLTLTASVARVKPARASCRTTISRIGKSPMGTRGFGSATV